MAEFLRRHRLGLSCVLLLAASFQLTSTSIARPRFAQFGSSLVGAALAPFTKIYQQSTSSVQSVWERYIYLVGLSKESGVLHQRLAALEARNSQLLEVEHENERLRQLLNFSVVSGVTGVTATVIGRDPSNWVRSITIDRGRNSGLRPGLSVFDGHGVVGQVISVTSESAVVLLLTDSSSAIDSLVQGSRGVGIVEGRGDETLLLRYFLKDYEVQVGDRVIASGLDGVYPKGALVGVVTLVRPDSSHLFQYVELTPVIDVRRIENVLVQIPEMLLPPITGEAVQPSGGE